MKKILFTLTVLILSFTNLIADEGMYPLSEIDKLNLKKMGLEIEGKQLYNPNGISLIDAIVNISGCTGSFVSPNGLILTNHHCAYRAANLASDKDNDFIRDGFLAKDKLWEIPAKGYTVRITESYKDVSEQVLNGLSEEMDSEARSKAIDKKRKQLVAQAEKNNPGKRAEVSEMFKGKNYVLFIYTYLKDIRMVYVPPRSIGEYGGETDNWEWPRHTGDFAFMRAYVAPDGSPADFSTKNVVYKPKNWLKVNPNGVEEEDFVFILGYPGRTFRHKGASFLKYETEVKLPQVAEWYKWQIDLMTELSKNDRSVALKHLSRIKSLANVEKKNRGKIQGITRLSLVQKKYQEEAAIKKFISQDPSLKKKYEHIFNAFETIYAQYRQDYKKYSYLQSLTRSVRSLGLARFLHKGASERLKDDIDREYIYMNRNYARYKKRALQYIDNFYAPIDKAIFTELLMRYKALPADQRPKAINKFYAVASSEEEIKSYIDKLYNQSKLLNKTYFKTLLSYSQKELDSLNDPFIKIAAALNTEYTEHKQWSDRLEGQLSKLEPLLVEIKKKYLSTAFIPDANSTLRLTYGYIRGYSPADAIYKSPITSLNGILQKDTGVAPFNAPAGLLDLIRNKKYGRFYNKKLNSVPVAILYNMDTTGGNSGSPILNSKGELIGVNFDRAIEATINDYAWSESYSRSIGVDIRYVLWVTQQFAGADYLLKEMGVN